MNASSTTARDRLPTGAMAAAPSGAIGAMERPLEGAPARVLPMLDEVERALRARSVVKGIHRGRETDGVRSRLRAEGPAGVGAAAAAERLGAPAEAASRGAALSELRERHRIGRRDHVVNSGP